MDIVIAAALAVAVNLFLQRGITKRLNQLERDMSEHRVLQPTKPEEKLYVPYGSRIAEVEADTTKVLRGAGVTEKKAYRAADLAIKHGWGMLDVQENIKMVRFMKAANGDVVKVNVYYGGKGGKRDLYTVATALNHPAKGKTQLFRKHITEQELEAILKNPRTHTEKGYYQNGGKR